MLYPGKNDLRCPVCLAEFNQAAMQAAGVKGCPNCHTTLQPVLIAHDGYIKINWQDLRVLAIYAQRWSITFDLTNGGNRDSLKALQNIINKLRAYEPKGGPPLVPPMDAVIINRTPGGGISIPMPERPPLVAIDEKTITLEALKPDPRTGLIPSPFYRRLQ